MIWATVSSRCCFSWLYTASPSLATKNVTNLIWVLAIWWCPCVKPSLVLLKNALSWHNSVSLCPASFCSPRPNLPVTPGISWFSTFHSSPQRWIYIYIYVCMYVCIHTHTHTHSHTYLVLVLGSILGLHRTDQLQLLQYGWLGHRLRLLWCWMALGNKLRSFCHFWGCTQVLHFGLFCSLLRTDPFLLRDSCSQ